MSNLFTCPDCKTEVSKTAKSCPKCGNNKIQKQILAEWNRESYEAFSKKPLKEKLKIYAVFLVLFTAVGWFVAFINDKPDACDCAEVGNLQKLYGWYNLSKKQQELHNDCYSSSGYTSVGYANSKCVDKVSTEIHGY